MRTPIQAAVEQADRRFLPGPQRSAGCSAPLPARETVSRGRRRLPHAIDTGHDRPGRRLAILETGHSAGRPRVPDRSPVEGPVPGPLGVLGGVRRAIWKDGVQRASSRIAVGAGPGTDQARTSPIQRHSYERRCGEMLETLTADRGWPNREETAQEQIDRVRDWSRIQLPST